MISFKDFHEIVKPKLKTDTWIHRFSVENYQYQTKINDPEIVKMTGREIRHKIISPNGKSRIIPWVNDLMTESDVKTWIKAGKPFESSDINRIIGSATLGWINDLQHSEAPLDFDQLYVGKQLGVIKKIRFIIQKDLEDKEENILIKELEDLSEIKTLQFCRVPCQMFFDSDIIIKNELAVFAVQDSETFNIILGDPRDKQIIPAPCVDLLMNEGWNLIKRFRTGSDKKFYRIIRVD